MKRTWRNKVFSAYWAARTCLTRIVSTVKSRTSLRWQGAVVGTNFSTIGPCFFKMQQAGSIRIGNHVTFIADTRSNRVGLTGPVVLETLGEGEIEIGDFSGGSSVVLSSRSKVTIGKHTLLGGNVRIFDHDFHSLDPGLRKTSQDQKCVKTRPVNIGDNVLIGANTIILKGVTVGNRAVIGAGAVVCCDISADEVWAGNPARKIKEHRVEQ